METTRLSTRGQIVLPLRIRTARSLKGEEFRVPQISPTKAEKQTGGPARLMIAQWVWRPSGAQAEATALVLCHAPTIWNFRLWFPAPRIRVSPVGSGAVQSVWSGTSSLKIATGRCVERFAEGGDESASALIAGIERGFLHRRPRAKTTQSMQETRLSTP